MERPTVLELAENDIRPDVLKKGQAACLAADMSWLLNKKFDFIHVPCPACKASNELSVFKKSGLDYVACAVCGTIYVTPRPSPKVLGDFYAQSENYAYWARYIFPASESARRAKIFRPRAERLASICRHYSVGQSCLVEVGAGYGTFCEEIAQLGVFQDLIAVEPTPDLAEIVRKKGFRVIEAPIETVSLAPGSADVLVSFEVIEHLFAPRDFVLACASLLKPGGLLVLSCPNAHGFEMSVLGAASDSFDHEHLNYFNPESLKHLLTESGLAVLEILTPGKLDVELVRRKTVDGSFDLSAHPFIKRILVDQWDKAGAAFQEFLADNCLSSHMWAVARKP